MDSFAAALQIAMPLTDQAWEQLKPRLLAQREAAEQQEREQMAHNQFLIQQAEERKQQEAQLREAKENIDREWEESQKSVREKLESYADTFVREQWQNGDAVTKASCAQFAADMLLHVRHRFYNALAQEDARMRAMGIPIPTDSPHAAPTRRLTLENMRWVYERKIKPLTEHFQKELFLCNACDNHSKYYTLDSVVQHYAAKHTDSLSMGTAVVYWKADWPELPPFDPNPTAAKASMLASATPSLPPPNQVMFNGPSAYQGHAAGPHVPSGQPMYPSPYNPQHTVQEPSQIYGSISAAYQEPPSPRHNFPHVEQPAFKAFNHPLTASNTPMHGYAIPQPLNRHEWQRQKGTSNILTAYSENGPTFRPAQHSDFEARPGSAMSILSQNQPYQNIPPSSYFPRPQPPSTTRPIFKPIAPGQPMGIYQVQIQELAHNAREIWDATSGITDMPDSVRVQVIIRHVVLRFKDKYTNEPNLALFTDGLNNNFQMSPMRALSGLSCRACATARRMSGIHTSDDNTVPERRLHTLPALVAHFQSAHVEHVQPIAISSTGIEMPRLDWKFDMVEMPDPSVVQNLIYSPGITQAKLNLIATVLPSYFPSPLPQVDLTPHIGVMHAVNLEPESTNRMQDHDVYMRDTNRAVNHFQHLPVAREGVSSDSPDQRYTDASDQENFLLTEAVAEDEYDPHRPAYVNAGRFGRPSLVLSHVQGRQSRYEDEEISGTGASDDQRTGRNAEAVYDNRRMSLIPERAIRSDDKPSARRLEIVAQEHPLRNGSIRENEARRAYHDSRPLPVERRTSPAREPLNAAEQFLQSFDLATDALQAPKESTPAVETLKLDDYCAETGGEPSSRPRPLHYSRLSERANAGTMEFSTKSSPSDPVSTLGRYETVDDGLIDQTYRREHDELHDGRIAESEVRIQRSLAASPDNQSSRARAGHLPSHLKSVRDSPARRPNSRFERYEAQRQGSQGAQSRSSARAAEPLPVGIGSDRDLYPPQRTAPRQVYATQPVERYRGYPYTDEVMYRRAQPQIQQIRYVEKPRYPNPSYDGQVEYVQVASRDSPPEGSYYIRRPVADDGTIEYDGYEPSRPQEQVFERNGHLYTRAPPSSQSYRDPYPRQVTYQ